MKWTAQMDETLKRLALEGYSMSQIAGHLNCGLSRSACIGRWHRLTEADKALVLPVKTKLHPGAVSVRRKRAIPKPVEVDAKGPSQPRLAASSKVRGFLLPLLPEPARGPSVGILDVTGCKWPVAEDPSLIGGHAFCNHEKADDRYCAYHQARNVSRPVEQVKTDHTKPSISMIRFMGAA